MCVCATATRRRRQMKLDRRFKKRDPVAAARRAARTKLTEDRIRSGKKN